MPGPVGRSYEGDATDPRVTSNSDDVTSSYGPGLPHSKGPWHGKRACSPHEVGLLDTEAAEHSTEP